MSFSTIAKSLGLAIILFFLALPALAQNTKGDRPQSSGGGTKRENRFKLFKKKNQRSKAPSYGRSKPRRSSRASTARKESKPGKSIANFPRTESKPSNKQRAWRGDITGRRIRTKGKDSAGSGRNVYPQSGRYSNSRPSERQRAWRGSASGSPVQTRSRTGSTKNVYSQRWKYVHNPSRTPQTKQRAVSNRSTLARLNRLQGSADGTPPRRKRKVVPRSASRSYIARRSTNIYASFPRPKRKQERAYKGDISGRRLRTKNYETPRPGISSPGFKPYAGRKRAGERPYRGPAAGSYRSATRTRPKAWTGDITGRRIRGRNYTSKKRVEGTPSLHRGTRSATGSSGILGKLPPKSPGIRASQMGRYQLKLRGRRSSAGGGSVSGRLWNNKQSAIPTRPPGARSMGIGAFSGNIKRQRPLKGGGSVSGKLWNNKQTAIPTRPPGARSMGIGQFSGNIKRQRPLKGGGSVSGKIWNNKETAIPVRIPGAKSMGMRNFSGNIKVGRPQKGGGSVSGKLWNNKEAAIQTKTPPASARKVGGYPGKIKMFQLYPGFSDQGEEFTGHIKRPRFWKDYIKNPKANEASIKKKRPKSATYAVGELQIRVKQRPHDKKKNAPEDALPGLTPTKETTKASQYARGVRRTWDYIHNPSSAEEARKVREPGKAFARATDYQGNIKMQKFRFFEKNRSLHPDARFVKINKNNVDGERDLLTNFKLWWARLFKKEETQPDHLKDKGHKPRYDKGEKGLWYE